MGHFCFCGSLIDFDWHMPFVKSTHGICDNIVKIHHLPSTKNDSWTVRKSVGQLNIFNQNINNYRLPAYIYCLPIQGYYVDGPWKIDWIRMPVRTLYNPLPPWRWFHVWKRFDCRRSIVVLPLASRSPARSLIPLNLSTPPCERPPFSQSNPSRGLKWFLLKARHKRFHPLTSSNSLNQVTRLRYTLAASYARLSSQDDKSTHDKGLTCEIIALAEGRNNWFACRNTAKWR